MSGFTEYARYDGLGLAELVRRGEATPAELVEEAIVDDRLWITPIIRMEILYSARSSAEYIAFEMELDGFRILRNDRAVADAAMSAIGELAAHSDGCTTACR